MKVVDSFANRKLSILVPLFNEEEGVSILLERLRTLQVSLPIESETIFVDDGSQDCTLEILIEAARQNSSIKIVSLSRNFGHQEALTAAYEHASGDVAVALDGDLQDPPELIHQMLELWAKGNDVVYAVRRSRKENLFKQLLYSSFYRILMKLSDLDIPLDSGDFSLVDRKVIDAINACPERDRFLRGIRAWAGFRQIGLPYDRSERAYGDTKYSFRKLMKLGLDGIISNSSLPIKTATYTGLITTVGAFFGILIFLVLRLGTDLTIPGQTSVIISIFFFGGVQLLVTGILGEYIFRIYRNSKGRPVYLVRSKYGFGEQ